MKPIYKPKGAALEYGELALNLHSTCPHRCYYCYAPQILHKTKNDYFEYKGYRSNLIEATRRQIELECITEKLIHIPFIGDAYPNGFDDTLTRTIILLLKRYGNHVQILTKNGRAAMRDFDVLDKKDWFGVSYAGYSDLGDNVSPHESGAGAPSDRLLALQEAKRRGIKTWVSCEPVLEAFDVLYLIEKGDYIDKFKIGKLNYHPSDINWAWFGKEAERRCKQHNRDYYIKDSLRAEMNKP
jgi:DNA repair photolyase